jgi:hypothetical protein
MPANPTKKGWGGMLYIYICSMIYWQHSYTLEELSVNWWLFVNYIAKVWLHPKEVALSRSRGDSLIDCRWWVRQSIGN